MDSELVWSTRKPAGATKLSRRVATRRKKHAKGVIYESTRARTRTSLIGVTIYQPDVEPSAQGRRLLDALNSTYESPKS
jgi:hypothetical protein